MFVLIIGGSSGIGKHLALSYLKLGHEVAIVADKRAKLEAARKDLSKTSSQVKAFCCDVSDFRQVSRMARQVLASCGCPDILVNNAGYAVYLPFEELPYEENERMLQVNLLGTLRCIYAFLPAMINKRAGHIVNVASIAGFLPLLPPSAYTSSKYGMVGLTEALRWELEAYNIHMHLVLPGRVQTDFFKHPTFHRRPYRSYTKFNVPVEKVSRAIIRAVEKDRYRTVVTGWLMALAIYIRHFWPSLFDILILKKPQLTRMREVRSVFPKYFKTKKHRSL